MSLSRKKRYLCEGWRGPTFPGMNLPSSLAPCFGCKITRAVCKTLRFPSDRQTRVCQSRTDHWVSTRWENGGFWNKKAHEIIITESNRMAKNHELCATYYPAREGGGGGEGRKKRGREEFGWGWGCITYWEIGRFYTRGRIIRLDELGQTFVVRLVIRL